MSLETFEKLPADKKEMIISTGIREFSQKSYKDVSTDIITKKCRISKGILFHYFGSKKGFYLYCLEKSMERLTQDNEKITGNDFYEILFDSMNRKLSLCTQFKDEMHMVNMASRDASGEIAGSKAAVLNRYAAAVQADSAGTLKKALDTLALKSEERRERTVQGLQLYINAVLNRYLIEYQQTPDQFFEHSEEIKKEVKEYIDLMLYGICDEEQR